MDLEQKRDNQKYSDSWDGRNRFPEVTCQFRVCNYFLLWKYLYIIKYNVKVFWLHTHCIGFVLNTHFVDLIRLLVYRMMLNDTVNH